MKFMHVADLHLDSPFEGMIDDGMPKELIQTIRDSPYQSLANIVDQAIDNQVDFMVIVGDLFDRVTPSVTAAVALNDQLAKLNEAKIPVYLSYGNHDFLDLNVNHPQYPTNVVVMPNEVTTEYLTTKDGKKVALTGFSYPNQWVTESMIADYPATIQADYKIGMLHGSEDSVHSTHANYAPFTVNELLAKNYDYWALGHIHKRQMLNEQPEINYPGNVQGRHINESGPKGCLMVSGDAHLKSTFIETAPIVWAVQSVTVTDSTVVNLIETVLTTLKDRQFTKLHLIRLKLVLEHSDMDLMNAEEILRQLQQQLMVNDLWLQVNAFITSIRVELTDKIKITEIDQEIVNQAVTETVTPANIAALSNEFFSKHEVIKADLNDADSQEEIINLVDQILKTHFASLITGDQDEN